MTTRRYDRLAPAPVPAEPSYEGALGQTRVASVHLPASGGLRSVRLYTQVNVRTHPDLRGPTLTGRLHLLETGETVSVPFLYHDPASRRFVLVVPEALGHRELHERARILDALSREVEVAVPSYVRAVHTVIGADALRSFLEAPSPGDVSAHEADLRRREQGLVEWQDRLAAEETRLAYEAEQYRRLEMETTEYAELLRAQEVDLQVRKETIDQWLEELPDDQRDGLERRLSSIGTKVALSGFPVDGAVVDALAVADEEIEEVDEDELDVEDVEDAVEEIVDDEDVEEVPDEEAVAEAVGAVDWPELTDELFADADTEMVARQLGDRLHVGVRVEADDSEAYSEGAELRLQLPRLDDSIVVLSLIDKASMDREPTEEEDEGSTYVRRLALDARSREARSFLESLGESESAWVQVFVDREQSLRQFDFDVRYRDNAVRLTEHLAKTLGDPDDRPPLAAPDRTAEPPPLTDPEHPFQLAAPSPAESVHVTKERWEAIREWSEPDKQARVLLVLGVPQDVVDKRTKQALADTLAVGLALPEEVRAQAVSLGLGPSTEALTAQSVESFFGMDSDEKIRELTVHEVADNWRELLTMAEGDGIALRAEVVDCAQARIRFAATAGAELRAEPSGSTEGETP